MRRLLNYEYKSLIIFPPSSLYDLKKNQQQIHFCLIESPNLCQLTALMSLSCAASLSDLFTGCSVHSVCRSINSLARVLYINIYAFTFHCTSCRFLQLWSFASRRHNWNPNSLSRLRLTLIDNQTSLHIRHLWDQLNYLFNVTQLYATLVHQSTVIPDS